MNIPKFIEKIGMSSKSLARVG